MKQIPKQEAEDSCNTLSHAPSDTPVEAPASINVVNVVLLFAAAMLYDFAVGGAINILSVFVLKEPLSWNATQVTF